MRNLLRFPTRRLIAASAVTGALLVPLVTFGGPALAYTASALHQYGQPGAAQYQYRVTVCHHTGSEKHPWHLITISNRAVAAHLRHGDQLTPCTTTVASHYGKPEGAHSPSQSSQSSKHDDDDDHGDSNLAGNGNVGASSSSHAIGHGHESDNGHHGKS